MMAVLIIMTFFNFRKANANKALKKKTKDGKAGYHDRLSKLSTDSKQVAQSKRGQAGVKMNDVKGADTRRKID